MIQIHPGRIISSIVIELPAKAQTRTLVKTGGVGFLPLSHYLIFPTPKPAGAETPAVCAIIHTGYSSALFRLLHIPGLLLSAEAVSREAVSQACH